MRCHKTYPNRHRSDANSCSKIYQPLLCLFFSFKAAIHTKGTLGIGKAFSAINAHASEVIDRGVILLAAYGANPFICVAVKALLAIQIGPALIAKPENIIVLKLVSG